MTRNRPPPALRSVRLWWYAVALVPIALLVIAPLEGWVAGEVIVAGAFLLFFWIFSFAFAIYTRLSKRPEPRQ
jgi:hypothetical protein